MTSSDSKDQARFFCHCGKSFIRKEHLRRHESSHAAPAFVCQVCQRSFTRNDLLRRHVALHGEKGTPAPRRAKACNACHESKVKCDGGERCSLCVKRGIACSYDRDAQQPISDAMQGVMQDTPPSANSASSVTSRASNAEESDKGLALVLTLLRNGIKVPTRAGIPEELREVEDWWQLCSDRYRLGFHNHWPILHYPTIQDFPRNSMWVEAAIAMVATWATFGPGTTQRERALEIHDWMMNTVMTEIMKCSMHDDLETQAWPWEVWVIALINVVFALETGRAPLMRRADRVFDMVLSDCRQRGAFYPQKVQRHQQLHIPGQFAPWVFKNTEQFYKIAAVMFKIDTCLSLSGNRAPRMRREELHGLLPLCFTQWNAFGLAPHFDRFPHQPPRPEQCSISHLLRMSSLDFPVFYEDLQLVMCEATQRTWELAQTRRMDANLVSSVESLHPMDIKKKIIMCCKEIRRLRRAMMEDSVDFETRKLLLWAYTGKEEPGDPGWQDTVSARIMSISISTLMLQCLANMNLHADVQLLQAHLTQPRSDSHEAVQAAAHIATWAHSPDGRLAFLHAMATFIHGERRSQSEYAVHTDICTALAITTSSIIMQAWLTCILRDDEANSHLWGYGSVNLKGDWLRDAVELPEEVVRWAETGTPIAAVDGWPLRREMYGQLLAKILSQLQPVRETWPLCELVAAAIEARIQKQS